MPRNNHWLRRSILVFAFVLFDYLSTLAFCCTPQQEANAYAKIFMENFGIHVGLTLFVLIANLPLYMTLSLDSHLIRIPQRVAIVIEPFVDIVFAWFVVGSYFSGGSSWFWPAPHLARQFFGAFSYLTIAFLFVKPHKPCYNN